MRNPLPVGTVFDTPYEKGCVVAGEPDIVGNFDAHDSDGVLCSFSPVMVSLVHVACAGCGDNVNVAPNDIMLGGVNPADVRCLKCGPGGPS